MTDKDYLFGMNYVEQFQRQLNSSEHSIERMMREGFVGPKGPFGRIRNWSWTPEGRAVWTERYNKYRETFPI